jgi:predicted ribosomally synthesized peptide with nif11-like leader
MSVESLKKYGKLCEEDLAVRAKAKEIGLQDMEGHIAHAKSLGLEISKEDFEALAKEAGLDGENELSEEDLKKVAGGVLTVTATSVLVGFLAALGIAVGITRPGAKW